MRQVKVGSTDITHYHDISDSGDGTPETGVTSASGGLALSYVRNRAAAVGLTESDLAAVDSAHSDGGLIHVGNGAYRVDWPDAAFAAGVDTVELIGTVTGMVVFRETIQLIGYNPRTELTTAVLALIDAAISSITAPTASAVADAILNRLTSAITTAGSIGKLIVDNLNAAVSTIAATVQAASTNNTQSGFDVTRYQGDDWSFSATLGALTGWEKIEYMAKADKNTPDASALLHIRVSNPSDPDDGLILLNGAATTDTYGSIVVDTEATGATTFNVKAEATAEIDPVTVVHGVKVWFASGEVQRSTKADGMLRIYGEPIEAID